MQFEFFVVYKQVDFKDAILAGFVFEEDADRFVNVQPKPESYQVISAHAAA